MSYFVRSFGFYNSQVQAFIPSDIPNIRHWYGDTVNSGVNRNTLSNGDTITTWNDQVAGGSNWFTSTAGSPTYFASTNSIRFNGTNQALRNDIRVGFTGGTVFWVATINRTNINTYQTGGQWLSTEVDSGANRLDFISKVVFGSVRQGLEFYNLSSFRGSYGTATALGTIPHIFSYSYLAGGNIDLHLDGNFVVSGNTPTNINDTKTRYRILGAARRSPAVPYGDYDAYEMIVYDRKLNNTERGQVETYLKAKYSIA